MSNAFPEAGGVMAPAWPGRDACGTGFVASIEGVRSHSLVELAIQAVVSLTHRGAVNADPLTGDGTGITIEIPFELLREDCERLGSPIEDRDDLGVAMVFLPHVEADRPAARAALEEEVQRVGISLIGWREVPHDPGQLGPQGLDTVPGIEQLLLRRPAELHGPEFERRLYLARRRAERTFREQHLDAYVVSMSSRTVVYKGLMIAPRLQAFLPDLADERVQSRTALFHQRYATNTLPEWNIAQPFRMVAHNGEFNTLLGNRNWMTAREPDLNSAIWGEDVADLTPVIHPLGSDTASFDEALELLVMSGRDLLHSMRMLIPEAWENMPNIHPHLRSFYEYHAALMEPWDGPAAVVFTNGSTTGAVMDRNGLRPARYQVTDDGMVIMGSEVGLIDMPARTVVESGRIGPGQMIAVDTARKTFLHDQDIARELVQRRPYGEWVDRHLVHLQADGPQAPEMEPSRDVLAMQHLHGYTREEVEYVIKPMAQDGKEPVGSMGDDTPLSALQNGSRLLYTYFKQRFAQVTNPAIDSIREEIVMSLDTYLGRRQSVLESTPEAARLVHLTSPLMLDEELKALRRLDVDHFRVANIHARFRVAAGPAGLEQAIDNLCAAASMAVDEGDSILVISDRLVDAEWAPVPMLLAVGAVHHHLMRTGRRMRASIIAETGDARDVHHFAALIGFGASAIIPYVAFDVLRSLTQDGAFGDDTLEEVFRRYGQAVDTGILKIMSKMGISAVASYHGGQIFEALGVGDEVIAKCFPGTTSRIGGVEFEDLAADIIERHARAFPEAGALLPGGWYKFRREADHHGHSPDMWRALHKAVAPDGSREQYQEYLAVLEASPPSTPRDLLGIRSDRASIAVDEVESVADITKRFQTGAMSLGALSPEAHEDIARAMNRLGARSNTGEGGEDPRRYLRDGDKHDANSAVKQVASGRFGVTPAYLAAAAELEIKISQGSKPGEGGQLPGFKVNPYIATLRHVMPNTPLISPPPHHDIYSIEDISQLIYDLKMVNPEARVCVKLVACEGVGTIAAGVAKAYADVIQISGAEGGTGASPLSSIKYAGIPWELGLAETQEVLVTNGLRGRVTLRTDGGLKRGRDVVFAALLGAEQYGFGTTAMIAVGCKMARQCHLNTCPVGVATQREDLREKYFGTPEMLVAFMTYVAEEVRELLAELGYRSVDELIGRADLLYQLGPVGGQRSDKIDLSRVITPVDPQRTQAHTAQMVRNERTDDVVLDDQIIEDVRDAIEQRTPVRKQYPIKNTNRSVGARLSGRIARRYGDEGLPYGTIDLHFTGSAGQSFGAFLTRGVRLHLTGEANDYVAKGMNGGDIVVRPHPDMPAVSHESVLVGNTVLYGATGGSLFIAGRAGERFGVRNSGARAVVEGIGDHGCEYMTDGVVVILGETGRNFGAGMSNGVAFVLDERGDFRSRVNQELVGLEQVTGPEDIELLEALIRRHEEVTGSTRASEIMADWRHFLPMFWKVAPKFAITEEGAMTVVERHLRSVRRMRERAAGAR
ncbi:MAG: glutamate synthase large subunit [Chloroflexi bacterium]|nr:glutamate synthase large subunit [Chloroflexota bacterium]MDA1145202.1 glutamate synthase large subunit [Chloroflexota bacterium]